MPSSVFFNGQNRYRPNVYTQVQVSEGPTATSTGAIAVVGDFPELKKATPITFSERADVNDYFFGSSPTIERLAKLMFRPTADQLSQIQSLTLVNANTNTQASYTDNGVKVSSKLYGATGNRSYVQISSSNSLYNLKVYRGDTLVEQVEGLGEGQVATLTYTPHQSTETFDEMNISVGSSLFSVDGKINKDNATVIAQGDLVESSCVAEGNVTLSSTQQQSGDATFTIVGLGADGNAVSESLVMTNGTQSAISTNVFSQITSITNDGAFTGDLSIVIPIFVEEIVDITNFGQALEAITQLSSELTGSFVATLPSRTTKGEALDFLTADCYSSAQGFTTDVQNIVDWFNLSQYVEATRLNGSVPGDTTKQRLTGGSKSATVSTSDFQTALDSIKNVALNIVVPFSTDVEIHKIAKQHAIDSADQYGYERNVWVGTPSSQTVESVKTSYVNELNDRNVAVVCQGLKLDDGKTYDPRYTACLLAGMQGATPVATPLTRKEPTPVVLDTDQSFDVEAKASLAIRNGIVLLTDPRNTGLRVERSVTTYSKDDNKIFTEVSANESLNICVRQVREDLQSQIGTRVIAGKASEVNRVATKTLQDLVKVGFILSFKDVAVNLVDDRADVSFAIEVTQPLNFITATINVGG